MLPSAIYSSTARSVEISYVAQHAHTKLRCAQRNHTHTHHYYILLRLRTLVHTYKFIFTKSFMRRRPWSPLAASSATPHMKSATIRKDSKQLLTNLQPSFEIQRRISNNEELGWTDGEVPNVGRAGCAWTPWCSVCSSSL